MPKRDRYEHLALSEALRVLAVEGSTLTKDEKEILCQIAEKIEWDQKYYRKDIGANF